MRNIQGLQFIKTGKAAGQDRINGHILKLFEEPLTSILCKIFQIFEQCSYTNIWKTSKLIRIPKKSPPTCKYDYQLVALTSIMKYLKKIKKTRLCQQVQHLTDHFQFPFMQNQSVEDGTLSFID